MSLRFWKRDVKRDCVVANLTPSDDNLIQKWLETGARGPLPDALRSIRDDEIAVDRLLQQLSLEGLLAARDALASAEEPQLRAGASRNIARRAFDSGDIAGSIDAFRRSLSDDASQDIVRIQLAGLIYAAAPPQEIFDLLFPATEYMLAAADAFILHISWLICASKKVSHWSTIRRVTEVIGVDPNRMPALTAEAFEICRRSAWLSELDFWDVARGFEASWRDATIGACFMLTENRMIDALEALKSQMTTVDPTAALVILSAVCRRRRWSQAYRVANQLIVNCIGAGHDADIIANAWAKADLPRTAAAILSRRAQPFSDHAIIAAQQAFQDSPSLQTAERVWDVAIDMGHCEAVLYFVSSRPGEIEATRTYYTTIDRQEDALPPIWFFMTWRDHAARLLSNLSNLHSAGCRTIISVGGNGAPSDFRQATAAMLVPGIFFLDRSPISWGGPRLLFQTVLEVMRAFQREAPSDAWFQVICDRTFPIKSITEFRRELVKPEGLLKYRYLKTIACWNGEFSPEQNENLPALFNQAIDSVFETLDASNLLSFAGPWPLIADDDYRLRQMTFNFGEDVHTMTGNTRLGGQSYAISPFDVDIKWVSLARLHSFVDSTIEGGPTYSRRQSREMQNWVHTTLRKHPIHVGDPFIFASKNFTQKMFGHSDFSEITTASELSFAPEMTFFDSFDEILKLPHDFFHLYQRIDGAISSEKVDELYYGSDVSGHAFFRKSDPLAGAVPQSIFAERIIESQAWNKLCWVCAQVDHSQKPATQGIDKRILDSLPNLECEVRDMLARDRVRARFADDGRLYSEDGVVDAIWSMGDNGNLTVDFRHPVHKVKLFKSLAADQNSLTLAGDFASEGNLWGRFLSFNLDDIIERLSAERWSFDLGQVTAKHRFFGSPDIEACLLASMAHGEESLPTAALQFEGSVLEYRVANGEWLALCSINGFPTLLRLLGFGFAAGVTLPCFSKANHEHVLLWDSGVPARPAFSLTSQSVTGRWLLELMEGTQAIELRGDSWILDEADTRIGRWALRSDGVQIFGLEGLRIGLADQLRLHDNRIRLSGLGQVRMGRRVTFALSKLEDTPMHSAPDQHETAMDVPRTATT